MQKSPGSGTQPFSAASGERIEREKLCRKTLENKAVSSLYIQSVFLMRTKVQKWGNSLAVRIPKSFVVDAHLSPDCLVEIRLEDDHIIIKPVAKPSWTLEELLAGINKRNVHREVYAGPAQGKEIW